MTQTASLDPVAIVLVALLVLAALVVAVLVTRARGAREIAAVTARFEESERKVVALTAERDAAFAERERENAARHAAEREAALARQRVDDVAQRLADFATLKEETLKATQAAVLTTAQQLSSKLIEDNRREAEVARKAGEEQVKMTTETLLKQVGEITSAVSQLKGQVAEKSQVLDTVWRALTSPGGAGHFAEVGLANTLTSFGLEEGRDFVLQATTADPESGRKLRPDAIIFLPGNSALVIDCKASKFLVEIAEAEGTEREAAAYQNLARTMNQHLKDLADRGYRNAVGKAFEQARRPGDVVRIVSVMYLPNDAALEKLYRADASFAQKAAQWEIIPAGPAGLASAIGFASVEIGFVRRLENQEKIVQAMQNLLESVGIVVGHTQAVGKGIKSAADGFAKLTSSVNQRLLPRVRTLSKLGLTPNKGAPPAIAGFQVTINEIDVEAEDVSDLSLPPPATE